MAVEGEGRLSMVACPHGWDRNKGRVEQERTQEGGGGGVERGFVVRWG